MVPSFNYRKFSVVKNNCMNYPKHHDVKLQKKLRNYPSYKQFD